METTRVSSLDAHLGYWLRFVSNHVSLEFGRKLEARDVSVAEWVMLRDLFEHTESAPSTVAARLGMTRGGVTKLSDRLAAKGLLSKTGGEGDRRFAILALTRSGRALVPKLARIADENDGAFFHHLTAADRDALERILRELVVRNGLRGTPID